VGLVEADFSPGAAMTTAERHAAFLATVRNLATAPRGEATTCHAHLAAMQRGLLDALDLDASRAAKEDAEAYCPHPPCDNCGIPATHRAVHPDCGAVACCGTCIEGQGMRSVTRIWEDEPEPRRLKPIPA